MSFYNKFLGIEDLPKEARVLFRNYSYIDILFSIAFSLSGTFMILYIIDSLGFKEAALISAIMMATQLALDYPFGSLSDWIGQRWVLMSATISAVFCFILLSNAYTFNQFVVVAMLFGFTQAQASGTTDSWFDNQYKKMDVNDPDRKNYGYTRTRIGTISFFAMGFTFIIGGILASSLGRNTVFIIQAGLVSLLTIAVFFLLRELPTGEATIVETSDQNDQSKTSYFSYLIGGLKFVASSKAVFLILMSIAVSQAMWAVWGNLMLFPLYFGYAGSDTVAGLLRSVIFFSGVFIQIAVAAQTKKVENTALPKYQLFMSVTLFIGGTILLLALPPTNSFSWLGLGLVLLIMTVSVSYTQPFVNALFMRMSVDLIPSENRNAIYSLIPSLGAIFGIPLLPIAGSLIEANGLYSGFLLLLGVALVSTILMVGGLRALSKSKQDEVDQMIEAGAKSEIKIEEIEIPAISGD